MKQLVINQFEKIVSQDINDLQKNVHQSMYDGFLYHFTRKTSGFLGDGFSTTRTSLTTVSVAAGRAYYYDNTQTGYEPKYRSINLASALTLTIGTSPWAALPASGYSRYDIIVIRPKVEVTSTASRYVKTGGTGPIALQTIDKVSEQTYEVDVVEGTPVIGTPSVPATPSGWLKVCDVLLDDTGIVSQDEITDRRIVLVPDVGTSFKTAGETLAQNDLVYVSDGTGLDSGRTAGRIYKADTSITYGSKRGKPFGIVTSGGSAGSLCKVTHLGLVTTFSGLVQGTTYYVDPATPGAITATKPTTSGQFVTPVGAAISDTDLFFVWANSELVYTPNTYPNFYASDETELATAITNASSNGGGVICILNSFTVSSTHTIPDNTLLLGRKGGSILTLNTSGKFITSIESKIQDVYITTALTGTDIIEMTGHSGEIRGCDITIPTASTFACISVSADNCTLHKNTLRGVIGSTAIGIDYNSGIDCADYDTIFTA
jgi:hypothetical protein